MPTENVHRNLTPRVLQAAIYYVDGRTAAEVADRMGVAEYTVKANLVVVRRRLRAEGYKGVHTVIGLRKALRARGDIDHLTLI